MKFLRLFWFVLMLFTGLATPTFAQIDPDPGFKAERQRINMERARRQTAFNEDAAACYKKFAVNACLGEVNDRRREALADLKRQEALINDQERKIKGEEQLRKIEEKTLAKHQRDELSRQDQALVKEKSRLARETEKRDSLATRQSKAQSNMAVLNSRTKNNDDKAVSRALKSADEAAAARAYAEKQAKAEQRRAANEKQRRERTKPPAKPLPLPE
jgi:colicin import membrane protein